MTGKDLKYTTWRVKSKTILVVDGYTDRIPRQDHVLYLHEFWRLSTLRWGSTYVSRLPPNASSKRKTGRKREGMGRRERKHTTTAKFGLPIRWLKPIVELCTRLSVW